MSARLNSWTTDRLIPNEDNAIGLSGSPAAVVFNNRIYLFHQGRGNDGLIWFSTFDGYNWDEDRKLAPGSYYGIQNSPSAAVFNDKIYVVYHDPSDDLRVGTMDSWGNWANIDPGYKISYSPAVAVCNGKIWIVYQGGGGNSGTLMVTSSSDGTTWEPERRILDVNLLGSPCLTVYRNYLQCFHKGTNNTIDPSQIKLIDNILDELPLDPLAIQAIEIELEVASAIAPEVDDVKLLINCGLILGQLISQGTARAGDWVWHTAFNGNQWLNEALCPSAADAYGINSEGPAAIEYAGGLFCIRQGRDNSYLWCGVYDGENWHTDEQMGENGNMFLTTGAPALAVLNGTLYCFHQGHDDSGWMWMTTTTAS
ncbi:MAG: hypothetical protein WCP85_25240 [Mariniphaga sp.]